MKISKEAIEAGVRAYWLEGQAAGVIFTHTTYDDMDRFIREGLVRAFTKGVEVALQELSALQDCKVSPKTVQSPPATATQVAIDDEEVERVKRAIFNAANGQQDWLQARLQAHTESAAQFLERKCEDLACAAIRAIREGGQRWGVWNVTSKSWVVNTQIDEPRHWSGSEDDAKFVCVLMSTSHPRLAFQVLPYPGEREKTAEWEEAMKAAEEVYPTNETYTRGELLMRFARKFAAIRDAKGGK